MGCIRTVCAGASLLACTVMWQDHTWVDSPNYLKNTLMQETKVSYCLERNDMDVWVRIETRLTEQLDGSPERVVSDWQARATIGLRADEDRTIRAIWQRLQMPD